MTKDERTMTDDERAALWDRIRRMAFAILSRERAEERAK